VREDGQRTCWVLGQTPGLERILLYDDMEGLVKWTADGLIPIGGIVRDTAFVFGGNYSLRLRNVGPPPDGLGWWYVYRTFAGVSVGVLECVGRFKLDPLALAFGYGIVLAFYRGGIRTEYGWRYNYATQVLEYIDPVSGQWFGWAAGIWLAPEAWHEVVLRADVGRGRMGVCGVDGFVYDLSEVRGYESETSLREHARCNVITGRYAQVSRSVWIDDVLVRKVIE